MDQEFGILPIAVSITQKDNGFHCEEEFVSVHQSGLLLSSDEQMSALLLFELYFDDEGIDMLVTSTLSNAEARKEAKKIATSSSVYTTKEEMMAFIGSPILMVYM